MSPTEPPRALAASPAAAASRERLLAYRRRRVRRYALMGAVTGCTLLLVAVVPWQHLVRQARIAWSLYHTSTNAEVFQPEGTREQARRSLKWPGASITNEHHVGALTRSAPIWKVVGFGDSVPRGSGCPCDNYVSVLGRNLANVSGRPVEVHNFAVNGTTLGETHQIVEHDDVRRALSEADVVTMTVGANDVATREFFNRDCDDDVTCWKEQVAPLKSRFTALISTVKKIAPHATVAVTGYWNVVLAGPRARALGEPYVQRSTALTVATNDVVREACAATGAVYVDVFTPFIGTSPTAVDHLLAPDGDHPNGEGHRLLAREILVRLA